MNLASCRCFSRFIAFPALRLSAGTAELGYEPSPANRGSMHFMLGVSTTVIICAAGNRREEPEMITLSRCEFGLFYRPVRNRGMQV